MVTASLLTPIFDETLALLEEARSQAHVSVHRGRGRGVFRFDEISERLRVTARLSHVMAWVLARRAVEAGEISEHESRSIRYRLDGREVCFKEAGEDPERPMTLARLLERSLALYARIARLDDLIPPPEDDAAQALA